MDNMYYDTYFFFVPNRILLSQVKDFISEPSGSEPVVFVE